MSSRATYSPSGRIPQRTHGHLRREAMIDAASAILSEIGEDGLTLHAAAQRANSSVGSMYHFFSDRDQLLRAVADRHRTALCEITAPNHDIPPQDWQAMPADALIRRLFQAPLDYFAAHPDALVTEYLQDAGPSAAFQALLLRIMQSRYGEAQGTRLAATLYAVSTGTITHVCEMRKTGVMPETIDIPGVLIAYLERAERDAARD